MVWWMSTRLKTLALTNAAINIKNEGLRVLTLGTSVRLGAGCSLGLIGRNNL
jgi:hypothetical protein